ncbi:MAG: glycosyltransferase family 25 protein [Chlamydiia bacterium]
MKIINVLFALLLSLDYIAANSPITENEFQKSRLFKYAKKLDAYQQFTNLSPINCVYVINLDFREGKWNRVKSIFKKYKVFPTRFSAVEGFDLSLELQNELTGNALDRFSPGQIGCFLSHLSVWRHAYENNLDYIWVCEDDILAVKSMKLLPKYIQELNQLDPDWDVFYTDMDQKVNGAPLRPEGIHLSAERMDEYDYFSKKLERRPFSDKLLIMGMRLGTTSYILSKKGIEKFIRHFLPRKMDGALDADIHHIRELREYCPTCDIVTNWSDGNTYDTNRSDKDQKFLPYL